MALAFIVGRAGSGKTHECLDQIRKAVGDEPLILLVPEQATYQMEKAVYCSRNPNAHRTHVLSFGRLAWRVFAEGKAPAPAIDEIGKRMALYTIVQQCRDRLSVFGAIAARRGFIESLSHCMKEMMDYGVSPEDIPHDDEPQHRPLLDKKLADLTLIFRHYREFLAGTYTDPDEHMSLLAARIASSRLCRGARLWVDGFTGFTGEEATVLSRLIQCCEEVTVALTLDPIDLVGKKSAASLFAPTIDTYYRIYEAASHAGAGVRHTLVLPRGRFSPRFVSGDLRHLEAEFDKPSPTRAEAPPDNIRYAALASKTQEIEYIAATILALVRERQWRWNDIALLVHDLDAYRDTIESVFRKHSIPLFIDARRQVTYHPLTEMVRALCEIFTYEWPTDSVLRLLKTDLLECTRDEADRIENLALARGIAGTMWKRPERWADGGVLDAILRALGPVLSADRPQAQHSIAALVSAIAQVIDSTGVSTKLTGWADECSRAGDFEQASIHMQVLDGVNSVLRQASAYLCESDLPRREWAGVIETGLRALTLGMVPPSLDQVIAGSLDRSRHPSIKAAFVVGLVEGGFPRRVSEDPIFSDADRERLSARGLVLGPTSIESAMLEDYLAYVALTRPSVSLYLTRPLVDEEGRTLHESPVISKIRRVFPALAEERPDALLVTDNKAQIQSVQDMPGMLLLLARLASGDAGITRALREWLQHTCLEPEIEFLDKAARPNTELAIGPGGARRIFGDMLDMSVSRLEAFGACPFKHFASYGLSLRPREVASLDAPLAGLFMHNALTHLFLIAKEKGKPLGSLEPDDLASIAREASKRAAEDLMESLPLENPATRAELESLERSLLASAEALSVHSSKGRFVPIGTELTFGPDGPLLSPEINTSCGVSARLRGRIDLVDAAVEPDKSYFRVIDFKSKQRKLAIEDIEAGIDLQLAGYTAIVEANAERLFGTKAEPAAMLYFPLRDTYTRLDEPPDEGTLTSVRLAQRRMEGLLTQDIEAIRLMDDLSGGKSDLVPVSLDARGQPRKSRSVVEPAEFAKLSGLFMRVARDVTERIGRGEISITPYRHRGRTACGYCDFSAVCQFDLSRKENRYRKIAARMRAQSVEEGEASDE